MSGREGVFVSGDSGGGVADGQKDSAGAGRTNSGARLNSVVHDDGGNRGRGGHIARGRGCTLRVHKEECKDWIRKESDSVSFAT